ncbi:LLM class flavin-dependent oxidoreductase [Streptomyces mirabilis]|uniref:LLM class flavin-dependent oxidoreductase n=1 Tax=Streptomyces mirabilis TaxID=68239 RepID=UPI003D9E4A9E
MDHLFQIGIVGTSEQEMLEAYTTLGYLAASTERVELLALVTSAGYREPGLLAKMVTTLDVLSEGRAALGIGVGAGFNVAEARGLGLPFPPVAERFERLEETLRICLQMWSDHEGPFNGRHYRLERTLNSPATLRRPPSAGPDRRVRRAEDTAARRGVRQRLQPLPRTGPPAQARRAARAL